MTAPEDVRLRTTGALEITLYTRPGCHLCEEAKAAIEPLVQEFGARLREVNIDEDRDLTDRYGWDIPVLFVGTRKVAKHRVKREGCGRWWEGAGEKSKGEWEREARRGGGSGGRVGRGFCRGGRL